MSAKNRNSGSRSATSTPPRRQRSVDAISPNATPPPQSNSSENGRSESNAQSISLSKSASGDASALNSRATSASTGGVRAPQALTSSQPGIPMSPDRHGVMSLDRLDSSDMNTIAVKTGVTGAILPRPQTSSYLPTYKVLLIGDAAVGKSNLLNRFASNEFDLQSKSTIGVEFTTREIDVGTNNEKVNVQLWDTAGQERCGAISSAFFRNARGIAVCYDVTRKQSLLNVPRWVAHAKQFCDDNCQFVIIGNKTDLTHLKDVSEEEAEEISHILSTRHYYASALTGDGVPTAFLQLILSVHAVMKVQTVATPSVPTSTSGASNPNRPGTVIRAGDTHHRVINTTGFGNPAYAQQNKEKKKCGCRD